MTRTRWLARKGHEVHVYTRTWVEVEEEICFHPLTVIPYPRWVKGLSMALTASRVLRDGHFDVVQGFGGIPGVDVSFAGGGSESVWLKQEIRCRMSLTNRAWTALRRTLSLKLMVNLLLEKLTYSRSPLPFVVTSSNMVRDYLISRYRLEPWRAEVIYNGVDLDRFHPDRRDEFRNRLRREWGMNRDRVLLFVAHNFFLKGLGALIMALGGLRDVSVPWKLIVVGRGRSAPFLDMARHLKIENRLRFAGATDAPETFYGACDLLVHPCFYEPFGMVCLEAMACGTPILTTRLAGAHELIEHGKEGWIIDDPMDIPALRDGLMRLMTEVNLVAMGKMARRKTEAFSWDAHMVRLVDTYARAMALKGRTR